MTNDDIINNMSINFKIEEKRENLEKYKLLKLKNRNYECLVAIKTF